ncbi:MAG: ATP-binding protein [Oligoflexia bacterium]|jgi:predicted AAA+ superfamily ATPase
MKDISRILDLRPLAKAKTCFLFGPRQTGKTSLLRAQFPQATVIDLLDEELFLRLQTRPVALRDLLPKLGTVVIDEIQRVPSLLNEVHLQIEKNRGLRFILTGSSARKLRQKGVNLLGGRARSRRLHPFVWAEIHDQFNLSKVLLHGSLPSIFFSDNPREDIKSYVGDYLREEIAAEAATRNLPAFSRFLETAAITNGQILNYQKISNDAQVKRSTAQNYYEILRDTLIGTELEAYRKTVSRKATATSKFYFFDLGMVNYLKGIRELPERTPLYGDALEAYLHHELRSWLDYQGDGDLRYWRSSAGTHEVDFILNEEIAIECKATRHASAGDIKGLQSLDDEMRLKRKILVCLETRRRTLSGVEVLPLQEFLAELWGRA